MDCAHMCHKFITELERFYTNCQNINKAIPTQVTFMLKINNKHKVDIHLIN